MGDGRDLNLVQGHAHVHEAVGIILTTAGRQHVRGHTAAAAGDDPGGALQVSACKLPLVVDLLFVLVARDNEVNAGLPGNVRPMQNTLTAAGGVTGRMMHDHDLPVGLRLLHRVNEPLLLVGPEFLKPTHTVLRRHGPRRTAAGAIGAVLHGVLVQLAMLSRIALGRTQVVSGIHIRAEAVEDVGIQEVEVHAERLELHKTAPVLRRHDPATIGFVGVEDLLVPALDVADASIVVISQDAPPFDTAKVLHRVHLLKDLCKLTLGEGGIIGRAVRAMRIDATGVEVIANVQHELGILAVFLQFLGLLFHPGRHQVLRHVVDWNL
mmetsp:Transcript_56942/g.90196  ORF Transcript_56942/g.90196 Transcript_56942/m.90196 type:complete len:323 (-) Transcript_56942:585-1553(-)